MGCGTSSSKQQAKKPKSREMKYVVTKAHKEEPIDLHADTVTKIQKPSTPPQDRETEVMERFGKMHLNMIVARISKQVRSRLIRQIESSKAQSEQQLVLYKTLKEQNPDTSRKLITCSGKIFKIQGVENSTILQRRITDYQFNIEVTDENHTNRISGSSVKASSMTEKSSD